MAKSIFIICNGNSWTEQSKLLNFKKLLAIYLVTLIIFKRLELKSA